MQLVYINFYVPTLTYQLLNISSYLSVRTYQLGHISSNNTARKLISSYVLTLTQAYYYITSTRNFTKGIAYNFSHVLVEKRNSGHLGIGL